MSWEDLKRSLVGRGLVEEQIRRLELLQLLLQEV